MDYSSKRISSFKLTKDNYISTENMLPDFRGVVPSKAIPEDTSVILFNKQDILMSNIRPYLKKVWKADHEGGCSADVFVMKSIDIKCIPDFLHHLVANEMFISFVMSGAKGVKMPRGDKEQIKKYVIALPSIKEQKKISEFLSLLDQRISIQSKIIEDLKKLKSAISRKVLGDKSLLETCIKLADIGELKNGYAFQSSCYKSNAKYKIITISNVSGKRYINAESCNTISEKPMDIQSHQILHSGDILISLTGNVGRVSLCLAGDYLLNQRVGLLELKKDINKEFVYQVLSSNHFEQSMVACSQGAAQMNIGKKDIENYIIPYSHNSESLRKVANIIKAFDDKIMIEYNYFKMLLKQKNFFLSHMFI